MADPRQDALNRGRPPAPPERRQNQNTRGRSNTETKETSLRYPYEMLMDSTDYLKIEIAEYIAPQSNLANELTKSVGEPINKTNVKGEIVKDKDGKTIMVNPINRDFSLTTGSKAQDFSKKRIKNTIYLPIPQQLSDNTSVTWGDSGLSVIDAFGVSATAGIIQNGLKGVVDAAEALADTPNLLKDPQLQKAVVAALSGTAVGAIGGNVSGSQLVSRATGQVFNPNLELLFEGVNIRSFPFSFEFFPRDRKEAEQVKLIIRTLKKSMSARKQGKTGNIFISAPDVFKLTYMKGRNKHPFLNTFLPMALTSVNLTYTGSNTYSTFYDGTPTHMRMDLTFKELNPIYFEDYEDLEKSGDKSVGY